jgi:hypothetical protein
MKLLQFGAEEESVELKKGAGMVSHNLLWIGNKAEHRLSTKVCEKMVLERWWCMVLENIRGRKR